MVRLPVRVIVVVGLLTFVSFLLSIGENGILAAQPISLPAESGLKLSPLPASDRQAQSSTFQDPDGNFPQPDDQESHVADIAFREFTRRFLPEADRVRLSKMATEYTPFEVTRVAVDGEWARIHIMSYPETLTNESGMMSGPIFRGAVGRFVGNGWEIYFENTSEFDEIRSILPAWLSFLSPSGSTIETPFSIPALPWAVSQSWDHNASLHTAFDGTQRAFDFGTPHNPGETAPSAPVQLVDGGELIDTGEDFNDDGYPSTCVLFRNPSNGLQTRYQHIGSSYVAELRRDKEDNNYLYKNMGDGIGWTTTDNGCEGYSTGHHIHIEFYDDDGNTINPSVNGGSYLNDWRVSSSSGDLTKGNTTVTAGSNGDIFHRGCLDWKVDVEGAAIFDKKNCTGEWSIIFKKDGVVNVSNHVNGIESIRVRDGDAILVWLTPDDPKPACYDGSLWDLSKDYFPGTSISLWNNISLMKVVTGPCSSQPDACVNNTAVSNLRDPDVVASCEQAEDPPPEEPPFPPGPQQKTTVKLRTYANFEGGVLFSGREGLSNEPSATGYSLEVPAGWSVILYDQDNGNGTSRCFSGSVANLQDHGWHNRIQSIRIHKDKDVCPTESPSSPEPLAFLYSNKDYLAQLWGGGEGFHDNISQDAESLKVPAGWSVFVYEGDKRQIRAQCFNRNVPNLKDTNSWDNKIRGIEVFDFDVCQDELFGGFDWSLKLDEGFGGEGRVSTAPYEMPSVRDVGGLDMNDMISSIRIRAGYSIQVWEHDNFQGGSRCFSESVPTMRNDAFDNGVAIYTFPQDAVHDSRISSFKVYTNHYCDASPAMPETGWAYSNSPSLFSRSLQENETQSVTIQWVDLSTARIKSSKTAT